MRDQPSVASAAVAVRNEQLVAYVVGHAGAVVDWASVETALAARLPGYMVPTAHVVLEAFPLGTSGKLDRKQLPDPVAQIAAFRELDRRCRPETILATNSSGFPVSAIAAATDRPDRVVGWHWASPAPVMRFAEIVRGPATSDETLETVTALARQAGKNPIVVEDTAMAWGYVANRVYGAMIREAHRVADEGIATREEIDQLMVDCFRWPAGPFGMTRGATSGWS